MKACLRYAPMIGSREGELSAEDSRALAAHMADCPSCGAMAAEVAATEGLLREALLAKANARDFGPFVDQVMARLEAPARRMRPRAWAAGLTVLRARWRWFTVGTIAAVAAVSAFMYVHREPEPEQLASLEMDLEGGSTVLQTADGPVVLLDPDDSGS
jgi:anti-sigma factor RsiW